MNKILKLAHETTTNNPGGAIICKTPSAIFLFMVIFNVRPWEWFEFCNEA